MAEIGVLELQIKDNAQDAGTGLKSLAGALSDVKKAVGKGLGLSTVANQVVGMSKTINEALGTNTTVKNLASLFNSISSFSKIKKINIDTDSLEKFKTAISGFSIGNAGTQMRSLQQALSGTWSTDGFAQATGIIVSAGNIFDSNGTASKLSTVTNALTKFTKAYKDLPNSTKKMENVLGNFAVTDYKSEYEAAAERAREAFERSGRHGIAFDPQQFGGKGSGRRKSVLKAEQMQMDLDQIGTSVTEKYSDVETTIESTTRGIEDLNIRLHETKDTITSIVETVSAMQSSSLSIIPYSGGGGTYDQMFQHRAVAQENMLSTYVDYSKQFAPNWKEADTNINAADAAVQNLRDHMGDMNSYLENSTTYADRLAQSLGNMGHGGSIILYDENYYNRMMDKAREYWEYNKNTAEDAMLSTRRSSEEFWKPDFTMEGGRQDWSFLKEGAIEAEGSVSEQTVFSSIEEMAKALNMTVDEVKQKLQDTYNMVYSSGPSVTVFSSAEEAAKSLGKTVEEVLQEAQETYNTAYGINNSGSVADSTPVIDVDKFLETYSHLDYLEQKYDHLKGKLAEKLAMGDIISKDTIDKDVQTLKKLENEIKKLKESATTPVSGGSLIDVDQFIESYSHIDYLKSKLEDLKARLAEGVQFKTMDNAEIDKAVSTIQNLEDEIKRLEDAEKNARSATQKLANAFGWLKNGAKKLFPTLTGIVGRFASIAKYRVLRSIIKNISDGFKEGWENLKGYKDAIGDSFATSVGNANAQLLTMKNSIAAAVSPALEALIPVLNSVTNAVITVINWVNQLISLLTGKSTWTHAINASADAFDDVASSAGGASGAVKDLLADWDELNIIQSESSSGGGGGGSSTATDYSEMFEELSEFDGKIKEIVSWIEEHINSIKGIATAIGTAILAWKFSKLFSDELGYVKSLIGEVVGVAIGLQLTWEGAYNAGLNGEFDATTLLTTAAGVLATTISSALLGFRLGGTWGALIGGAFGLTMSILVGIEAYYDGDRTRRLNEKWGDLHLTEDEIKELVDSQVTVPVLVTMEATVENISNRERARNEANERIAEFSRDFETAKFLLEADRTPTGINDALESAKKAIDAIQAQLSEEKEGLKLSFTKFTYKNEKGEDVTKELYSSLTKGNTAMSQFFTDMGKEIADYIAKGYGEGLSENEELMAFELLNTFNDITETAKRNYEKNKLVRETNADKSNIYDLETANNVFQEQKNRIDQYKETVNSQMKADLESNYESLEYYKKIQEYYADKGNTKKVKEYQDYIDSTMTAITNLEGWMEQIKNGTYSWNTDDAFNAMEQSMANMWKEKLNEWFKSDFVASLYDSNVESPFVNNPTATSIMGYFGFDPSSFLTDLEKESYVKYVLEKNNYDQNAAVAEIEKTLPALLSEASVSKWFPDLSTEEAAKSESEIEETIKATIFQALLSGAEEGSEAYQDVIQGAKNTYGSDTVSSVYEEYFGDLKQLYDSLIEDMFSGSTSTQMMSKYSKYAEFVKMFINEFGDSNGLQFDEEAFNKAMEGHDAVINELQKKNEELKQKILGIGESNEEEIDFNALNEQTLKTTESARWHDPLGTGTIQMQEVYNQAMEAIKNAMIDGVIDEVEMLNLETQFGQDLYNKIIDELGLGDFNISGSTNIPNMTLKGREAATGASLTDFGRQSYVQPGTSAEPAEVNEMDVASGVQSGVVPMSNRLGDALSTLISICRTISQKDFTVNINASSDLGLTNKRSNQLASNVTGEVMNA